MFSANMYDAKLKLFFCLVFTTFQSYIRTHATGLVASENDNFNAFLENEIKRFHQKVADPVKYGDREFTVDLLTSLFQINGTVFNITYSGISQPIKIASTRSDLNEEIFESIVYMPNATFNGSYNVENLSSNYNLTGRITGQIPIGGVGRFTLSPYKYKLSSGRYRVLTSFTVVDDHVVLSNEWPEFMFLFGLFPRYVKSEFPGLIGSEIDEDIARNVTTRIGASVNNQLKPLLAQYISNSLRQSLQAAFDEVNLSDILAGVTLPPLSTPQYEGVL